VSTLNDDVPLFPSGSAEKVEQRTLGGLQRMQEIVAAA
jgi:hypothetical protein